MKRERHVLTGFMIVLALVLGVVVFGAMWHEYRMMRGDLIELATSEARVVLDTIVVAIQTTAGIRMHLQDEGVETNVVGEVVRLYGTGQVLKKLALRGDFTSLVCQDRERIIAAFGVTEVTSIDKDPFLDAAMTENRFAARVVTKGRTEFEAVRPFVTDERQYLLRVRMRFSSLSALEERTAVRLGLTGAIFVFVTFLLVVNLLGVHNARLLATQRDAITREVERVSGQLRQQERFAAMGSLAAGVAHEIRNPLNAIQINTQLLEREVHCTAETAGLLRERTRTIRDEIKRLDEIVEQFLAFARTKPPRFEPCPPAALIQEVLALEQGLASQRGLALRAECAEDIEPMRADRHQLKQALVNVVKNAIEATQSGGRIDIRAARGQGQTRITVEDNGAGMAPEVLQQAFDLYYTTKPGGIGLGLAITRSIIEQHGGAIAIRPADPRGVIVELTIPAWRTDEVACG
ncbi:hypothetical protein GX586_12090 [bacterium]|nr:hypothetical protein [bacterium]